MKSVIRLLLIFCTISIFTRLSIGQDTDNNYKKFNISFTADANSRYLWRGYTFSEGLVFQPAATISFKKFNLNIWSNFDLNKAEDSHAFNEFDIIFYYSYDNMNLEIQPYIQFYLYPGTEESSTGELTLNAAYTYKNIKFFTSQNIDFLNYKGAYYGNTGAGFEKEIFRNTYFDCGVSLGWANSKFNETYGSISKNAVNHFSGSAGLTFYPNNYIYAKLRFEYSNLLDKDLRELNTGQPIINWGLTLGAEL
jgi:hypothetical protein